MNCIDHEDLELQVTKDDYLSNVTKNFKMINIDNSASVNCGTARNIRIT